MRHESGLLTDLYELTMAAGYVRTGFRSRATFELFARHLPEHRNFLVVAGVEQALDFLESIRFTREEIGYLRRHPAFRNVGRKFFDYLARFRFSGDVWTMPEGTLAFAGEPVMRVEAPIAEAQLVETYLLSAIHCQTLVASKAARVVQAARGRSVIEFGSRRAHGIEPGVLAARAAVARRAATGHFECLRPGTSTGFRRSGRRRIPGSWRTRPSGRRSDKFLDVFPGSATLLVDTYDTRRAIAKDHRVGTQAGRAAARQRKPGRRTAAGLASN